MARSEYQATNIVRRLYADSPDSNTLKRAELFRAAGKDDGIQKDRDAVYSLISIPYKHGLISKSYSPRNHGLMSITLTDAGAKALGRGVWGAIDSAFPKPKTVPVPRNSLVKTSPEAPDPVTLEFATEVTDAFNAQSQHWEWRLVRKETNDKH